jgi:hypothetical protein
MTEKKAPRKPLNDVLNIRIDDALSREVDRIAKIEGKSASEAARQLLEYGVEVQRQIEASYLQLSYKVDIATAAGRVVIDAAWRPYTQRELWEAERDREDFIADAEEFDRR